MSVAAELLSRDQDIVLAGRDAGGLRTLAQELDASGSVRTHAVPVDHPEALRELAAGAAVLIHCAGPFSATGAPVAAAAAGCHYIDHALEPHHVKHVFGTLRDEAGRITFTDVGNDLWRAAALTSVEGAVRLATGHGPGKGGVFSPAEVFDPAAFPREVGQHGAFQLTL